jgi:hypothetical protein
MKKKALRGREHVSVNACLAHLNRGLLNWQLEHGPHVRNVLSYAF